MYRDKKSLSILKIKEGERNNASGFVEGLLVVSDYIFEKEKASLFHNQKL